MANDEKPLVTFALFAYNQEKYIREAVVAALAQDYPNLEIIISDDNSTDFTYQIIEREARNYSGPHRLSIRKNADNLGTALHVQSVFNESSGRLLVVAAGDDVSLPIRVTSLCEAWVGQGCPSGVVHSGWETFKSGETGFLNRYPAKRGVDAKNSLKGFARSRWLPAAAPTCAYTRDVFESFPPLFGGSIIEDAPLFLRAALVGRFVSTDAVLVRVRHHDNNTGTGYAWGSATRWNRFMRSKFIAFSNMQSDLAGWNGYVDPVLRSKIEARLLAVIRSVPKLILAESTSVGFLGKAKFFLRMITSPAVAQSFRLRMEYALSFFDFSFHIALKASVRRLIGI